MNNSTHAKLPLRSPQSSAKRAPLYGLVLVLLVGAAFEHRPVSRGPGLLLVFAACLWTATIVFTITMLVPINNRIAGMNPTHPYAGWSQDRARWDRLHQIRVALLTVALVLLLTGLLK